MALHNFLLFVSVLLEVNSLYMSIEAEHQDNNSDSENQQNYATNWSRVNCGWIENR
jgi:hypothetical protein